MALTQVLVVEDDEAIRRGIRDALRSARFDALEAASGEAALEQATAARIDLVLLDIVMPGIDGLQTLQQLKELRPSIPVIMLTARGAEQDRVKGLRSGADDYIVKPFSVAELIARVEAVLRRVPAAADDEPMLELTHGRRVDVQNRRVHFADGHVADLSERESELLKYFCSRKNQVVSRDELIRAVWQMNPRGLQTRTIDMHIARLREKLHDGSNHEQLIVTERGRGYRLVLTEAES